MSLRGSCPIDVAYFSFMDNYELVLALRESHLELIVQRLARCGVQLNPALLAAGYPDLGWDPVEVRARHSLVSSRMMHRPL